MKKISFIFCLLAFYFAFGQDSTKICGQLNELVLTEKNGKIRVDAEKNAVFSKANETFQNMIYKNFRMRKVLNTGKKKNCEVTFIIEKDGSLVDLKAFGSSESLNNEAIISVQKIKEKWIPAEMNGIKVREKFRFPIKIDFTKKNN